MEKYTISKEHLDTLILESSIALCGKVMKRFEKLDTNDNRKKVIKELIYENHRDLKKIIIAFSLGIKFITPKPKKSLLCCENLPKFFN